MKGLRIRLPQWLVQTLSDACALMRPRSRDALRCLPIDRIEPRILLADFTIPISGTNAGDDHITLGWFGAPVNQIYYEVTNSGGTTSGTVPDFLPPPPGVAVTKIKVSTGGGNDTITIDETYGFLSQATNHPSIGVEGGEATDTLVIIGSASSDTLVFHPDDSFTPATNNFTIDGTDVRYQDDLEHTQFKLQGGPNHVTVQGTSSTTQQLIWDDASFPPADNPGIRLTIDSDGEVYFGQSASLEQLTIQNDGFAGVVDSSAGSARTLSIGGLQLDTVNHAKLDLASNVMNVGYAGSSPAAEIVAYLTEGMGHPRPESTPWYGTGNWDGSGVTSSAARDRFPGALGYLDDPAAGVVRVRHSIYGDANLDGRVDITDLARLATHWHEPGGWSDGDFNYSGFVDENDLALLALDWQAGSTPAPAARPTRRVRGSDAILDSELATLDYWSPTGAVVGADCN